MDKEKYWLKFIISGKPEDYIKFSAAKKAQAESKVSCNSLYDGRPGNRAEQYRG